MPFFFVPTGLTRPTGPYLILMIKEMEKFIVNATFVMAPDCEGSFLDWMKTEAFPSLFARSSLAENPRLQTVIEIGGEKPGPDHGLSIALQADFPSLQSAHEWNDNVLPDLLAEFHKKFGPHALFFVTILKSTTLD